MLARVHNPFKVNGSSLVFPEFCLKIIKHDKKLSSFVRFQLLDLCESFDGIH